MFFLPFSAKQALYQLRDVTQYTGIVHMKFGCF